jgi:mRNA interferase HigB
MLCPGTCARVNINRCTNLAPRQPLTSTVIIGVPMGPFEVTRMRIELDENLLTELVDAWFNEVRKSTWGSTADVKRRYASASIVSAERVVFNIKGNDYRLVVSVDFEKRIVWIKWIGDHKQYDRISANEVKHGAP